MQKLVKNYDWNKESIDKVQKRIILADETLRDGLQGGSVKEKPNISQMQEFLHCIAELGMDEVNIGFPASSETAYKLAEYTVKNIPQLSLYCTGRATIEDIKHIIKLRKDTGANVFGALFIATSPIRIRVENWNFDDLIKQVQDAVSFATSNSLKVMLVTEDTTRTSPENLFKIYKTCIDAGATKICIADTVGQATPNGVNNIISYVRNELKETPDIQIEWHGHNDKGLATSNAIQAVLSGVNRISTTALGIGERAGNVPTHEFVYNLYSLGILDRTNIDITKIFKYSQCAAKILGVKISKSEPIIGEDIFTTESGVHASAIYKSKTHEDKDNVYSSVNARIIGRQQKIVVGPNSGKANVLSVIVEQGLNINNITEEQVKRVLSLAKKQNRQLSSEEILNEL